MRFPDFLIIGAMKAGTTTLYRDLQANSRIFLPADKEPNALSNEDVFQPQGQQGYADLFRPAKADQRCGEASTQYTKRPTFPGVPERARRLLGPGLKVIYLVREPVARLISHHRHFAGMGLMPADIQEALEQDQTLVDYGRYAMQIEPWIETLGKEAVRIVRFESYVDDRRAMVDALCDFLEVEPQSNRINVDHIHNKSENKPQMTSGWRRFRTSGLYQHLLRPLIPSRARLAIRGAVLPREAKQPGPPPAAMVPGLINRFRKDADHLKVIMGTDQPLWDFDQVLARYT